MTDTIHLGTVEPLGPDSHRDVLQAAVREANARAHAASTSSDLAAAEHARDQYLEWWAKAEA